MASTRLNKWGNSQGVILPKKLCERAGFAIGDKMEVAVNPRTHRIELFTPNEKEASR